MERLHLAAQRVKKLRERGLKLVVVVSAMGHQTNELHALAHQLHPDPPMRELDMLLTAGERISMSLMAIALDRLAIPSMSLTGSQCGILTEGSHGNARIQSIKGHRIRAGLAAGKVVIVAGFQGVDPIQKEITTLGRGGSDLTAMALAVALKADRCDILTDVAGVMTADPRLVPASRVIRQISWPAMYRMAVAGAGVLHHRAAVVARQHRIPVRVLSSFEMEGSGGTDICGDDEKGLMEAAKIVSITHLTGLGRIVVQTDHHGPVAWANALEWLAEHDQQWQRWRCSIEDSGVTRWEGVLGENLLPSFLTAMEIAPEAVQSQAGLASISVHGMGFRCEPPLVRQLFDLIECEPYQTEVTDDVISLLVPANACEAIVQQLHDAYL